MPSIYGSQPNRSTTREGSIRSRPPAQRTYTTTGLINQTGNERKGQSFKTFTKADRPGVVYHEYVVNGKRKVVAVKKRPNSLGG